MICFLCEKFIKTPRALFVHLKLSHHLYSGPFSCNQKDCFRSFPSMKSFKKHVLSCHFSSDNNLTIKSKKLYQPRVTEVSDTFEINTVTDTSKK